MDFSVQLKFRFYTAFPNAVSAHKQAVSSKLFAIAAEILGNILTACLCADNFIYATGQTINYKLNDMYQN